MSRSRVVWVHSTSHREALARRTADDEIGHPFVKFSARDPHIAANSRMSNEAFRGVYPSGIPHIFESVVSLDRKWIDVIREDRAEACSSETKVHPACAGVERNESDVFGTSCRTR